MPEKHWTHADKLGFGRSFNVHGIGRAGPAWTALGSCA